VQVCYSRNEKGFYNGRLDRDCFNLCCYLVAESLNDTSAIGGICNFQGFRRPLSADSSNHASTICVTFNCIRTITNGSNTRRNPGIVLDLSGSGKRQISRQGRSALALVEANGEARSEIRVENAN
jgi:hypothetical protein